MGLLAMMVAVCTWTLRGAADAAGERLYNGNCRNCHGTEGRGAKAPSLIPFDWSEKEAIDLVRHPVCDMPPIPKSVVSDAEIGQIINYLRTIK
jgi:cytochrome c oxidase cbb3-type subunit 3